MIKMPGPSVDSPSMTTPMDGEFDFFAAPSSQTAVPPPAIPSAMAQARIGQSAGRPTVGSAPQPRASHWAKSDTTFGPVGRVIASIALIIPFLFLGAAGLFTFDPFVLGGAGIWAFLMMTGLRQVWQAVEHHHRR